MPRLVRWLLALAMATSWLANEAWAQDGVLKFEVASVQRSLGDGRRSMALKPSGLSYSNVTLTDSLAAAYRIERYRVAGPDWLSRERYVIEAKASGAVEPSEIMQMLQSLLGERFGVKIHWERRELPIYLLRVLKGGPTGLKLVDTRSGVVPISGGMTFQGITMPEFVDQFLSGLPFMDRAVVDGTGLTGRYEFSLRIFPQDIPAGDLKAAVSAGGQDLFIDALEQIGLQLAREKRLVDVLVVDHAEAEPTDN